MYRVLQWPPQQCGPGDMLCYTPQPCSVNNAKRCVQRGKTPILVGGTGFYLRMYIYGKAGGKATPEAAARGEALIQEAKVACAASHDLAVGEVEEEELWNASVDVLLGLGDPDSAARYGSGHTCVHAYILSGVRCQGTRVVRASMQTHAHSRGALTRRLSSSVQRKPAASEYVR
jgi:hypothetical protein